MIRVAGAEVTIFHDHLQTIYTDGTVSLFYPPVNDTLGYPDTVQEFLKTAEQFGYSDPIRYGLEHDVTHHLIAQALGWGRSKVVWCDAHGKDWTIYSQEERDEEEHLVNRMLWYINSGEEDDDYGQLRYRFGDKLPKVATLIALLLKPGLNACGLGTSSGRTGT